MGLVVIAPPAAIDLTDRFASSLVTCVNHKDRTSEEAAMHVVRGLFTEATLACHAGQHLQFEQRLADTIGARDDGGADFSIVIDGTTYRLDVKSTIHGNEYLIGPDHRLRSDVYMLCYSSKALRRVIVAGYAYKHELHPIVLPNGEQHPHGSHNRELHPVTQEMLASLRVM
jgi:hypothetical protein